MTNMTSHRARETASHRSAFPARTAREGVSLKIELDPQESKLLRETLQRDLNAVRIEIAGIDWQDLQPEILVKEALLQRLLDCLVA